MFDCEIGKGMVSFGTPSLIVKILIWVSERIEYNCLSLLKYFDVSIKLYVVFVSIFLVLTTYSISNSKPLHVAVVVLISSETSRFVNENDASESAIFFFVSVRI